MLIWCIKRTTHFTFSLGKVASYGQIKCYSERVFDYYHCIILCFEVALAIHCKDNYSHMNDPLITQCPVNKINLVYLGA